MEGQKAVAAAIGGVAGAATRWTVAEALGRLGTSTTFSTLSDDVVELWRSDRRPGAADVAVTPVAGIGAAGAGIAVAG